MPKGTIAGWGIDVAAATVTHGNTKEPPGPSMTPKAQYLRAYRRRKREATA